MTNAKNEVMMSITLPAFIAVPSIQGGQINLIEASPFLAISLAEPVLAGMFYINLQ